MRVRSTDREGFSLIELLVVIAIVGVLVALIIPAISRSKRKAHNVQCVNNLRQQGIALQGFVADCQAYPLFRNINYSDGGYPGGVHTWVSVLEQWELSGKERKKLREMATNSWKNTVWHCPSTPDSVLTFGPATSTTTISVRGYGYNAFGLRNYRDTESLGLGGHKGDTPSGPVFSAPVKESEVETPSNMMAIGDAFVGGKGVIVDTRDKLQRTDDIQDEFGSTKRARARHQGKANVVFADGHVESPTLKFLFDDTTDASLKRWNRDQNSHRDRLAP